MMEMLHPERVGETRCMIDAVPDARLLDAAEALVAARIESAAKREPETSSSA